MSRVDDALLLRDTIQRIVDDKLGKERPKSSYALVTGFNPDEGTVSVIFDGDDISVDIPAGSIYPSEVGQTVRVGGSSGAKVIEDVMGENLTEVKAREAQETADGKNTVNYGDEEPEGTDHKDGDIWFDEGNSNMPHVWKDGAWVSIEDLRVAAIAAAQEELKQELDTVVENGVGTKTFYKPTQPTEAESSEGDLWFDTSEGGNNELHTYVNGQWVSAADARIAAIQQAQAELASDLEDVVTNGLGTKTFYKPTQPAVADSKEGDLWFDTSAAGKNALHVFTGGAWVSAADARLAELKDAQTQMTGDISAAQQRADEAFQDAADADSKAATAQSTANTAKSDAAAAAGIAGGKADVLIQSTTPATDMRKATTLWIDTTGSANTPKRWNGTAWVVVTDKAATDAASEAATAQTKADEAKSAADAAQTTATNAQTAASNAQSTATEALTSANSKNTVTRSTANPTTPYTGRVDDIWWKMSTLASGGRVIAQYRWSGTAWLTETIDNAVIANLDAAKITTGYLAAARIQANTLNADTVLVNGSLGSIILRDGAITTPKIAVGAITAESGVVASLDAGKITVGILDVARLGANSITADKVLLGGDRNMIPNGDLSAGSAVNWMSAFTYQNTDTPPGFTGAVNLTGTTTRNLGFGPYPVEPGQTLTLDFWMKADKAGSRFVIDALDQSGARLGRSTSRWAVVEGPANSNTLYAAYSDMPATWTRMVCSIVIPSGVTGVSLTSFYPNHSSGTERTATISLSGVKLYKAIGATLIEPGAITTAKLAAGAITAESGVVASLDAGKITVGTLAAARFAANTINADSVLINSSIGSTLIKDGAITTAKLAVGAITAESGVIGSLDASKITVGKLSGARLEADAINGMQIIGATLATSTTFPRVQMDNAGLHVYSSSTVRTFFADASTGELSIIGDFRTANSGARVEIIKSSSYWTGDSVGLNMWQSGASSPTATISTMGGGSITKGFEVNTIEGRLSFARYSTSLSKRNPYSGGSDLSISLTPDSSTIGFLDLNNINGLRSSSPLELESSALNAVIVNASGGQANWNIPFRKAGATWGYIGSPSPLGVDDFGIVAATGKDLVLAPSSGPALLRLKTDGTFSGLPMAGGRGSTGTMVANTPKAVAVTFPSGRFIGAPNVSLTISSTVPGTTVTGCGVSGVSSSGFTAYITRTNTTSTAFEWTAIETN